MKLLCVTRKYPPSVGGMEKYCYALFSEFKKFPDVECKVLALGRSQINLLWFLPYCILYLIFNAHKYDAIYYGDSMLCAPAFFAKLFSKRTRHVVDVHGLDVIYPNRLYQLYLKLFYGCFDRYICNSRDTENILHERGINNTVVLNRSVDADKFSDVKPDRKGFCKKYGIETDAVLMLTVGRLVKRKGVKWMVKNVMPVFKGQKVYYFIVGGGEDAAAIKEAIGSECLEDQIFMLGTVSDSDLKELYVNCDLFIMPNIPVENDKEGFGIVAIEASCAGLVVLASGIDGIVDAVHDGKNGYLLESGNAKAYIDKIRDYMQNTPFYKEAAVGFSAYTKKHYDLTSTAKKYIDVFKQTDVRDANI